MSAQAAELRRATDLIDASFWTRDEGDAIGEIHHHLDVLTMLQQMGALPG
jgi:hypothetical protein